jgi:DNA-binding NarL/FixJ family response regulator
MSWILETYLKVKKIRSEFLKLSIQNYINKIYLTPQENRILKKVLQGKTNSIIAQELKISKRNVERHIGRILNKTNIRTKSELNQLI